MASADSKLQTGSSETNVSGWLLKKKSDSSKSRIFKACNKRFFTLDFENKVLYYSNSEPPKKNAAAAVSLLVPFSDLLSVDPLEDASNDTGDAVAEEPAAHGPLKRSDSKGSLASSIRSRMPSFKRPSVKHGLKLNTTRKTMELLCTSKSEADHWIAAFRDAMARCGDRAGDDAARTDLSTAAGSSSPRSSGGSSIDAQVLETIEVQADVVSAPSPVEIPPSTSEPTACPAEKPPAQKQRSMLGLRPPKLPKTAARLFKSEIPAMEAAASASAGVEAPETCSDLADTSADMVASLEAGNTSLGGVGGAWGSGELQEHAKAGPRYADKGQGLSLQERLAQLDFSDDEDEEEDDNKEGVPQPSSTKAAVAATLVAEEDCIEPFRAADNSDDE